MNQESEYISFILNKRSDFSNDNGPSLGDPKVYSAQVENSIDDSLLQIVHGCISTHNVVRTAFAQFLLEKPKIRTNVQGN